MDHLQPVARPSLKEKGLGGTGKNTQSAFALPPMLHGTCKHLDPEYRAREFQSYMWSHLHEDHLVITFSSAGLWGIPGSIRERSLLGFCLADSSLSNP